MFDLKDPLFRFGVIASAAWLIASVVVVTKFSTWNDPLAPNAWGDLFAGVAAPMAFLWLVLGFLQQGKELQLSTKALMLQVDELKNTVKHQADLAQATREQVAASLRQEEHDRQARKRAAQPLFVLADGGSESGPQGVIYTVILTNLGAVATNVDVEAASGQDSSKSFSVADGNARRFKLRFLSAPANPIPITIHYTDAEGAEGVAYFMGKPKSVGMRFDQQSGPTGS